MRFQTTALLLFISLVLPISVVAFDQAKFKADIAWVTGANAADALSTRYMLNVCDTCYERFAFTRKNMEAKKALGTCVAIGGLYLARRYVGDRFATAIRWIIVGWFTAWSSWNVYLAQ